MPLLLPVQIKLEVGELDINPVPEMAPLIVKVLFAKERVAPLARLKAPTVVLEVNKGLLEVLGMITSAPMEGT